jgi:hypothetical protein
LLPCPSAPPQELDSERNEQTQADDENAPQHAGGPAQAEAQIPLPVRREPLAPVDDEHLLLRHDGDDRRGGHATDAMPPRPHLEHGWIVRIDVRKNPLDRAVASTCEREADAVGEPVTGDGARRVEPLALAQCNRHQAPVPHYPAVRNSPS